MGSRIAGKLPSREILPVASLYFWRHPEENDKLFYGDVSVFFNDLFFAKKFNKNSPLEWVTTFENFTLPVASDEIVDGQKQTAEAIYWGYVHPGFGLGVREQINPGQQDNMAALDWTIEPGFLYFGRSNQTAPNFLIPQDTFDLRTVITARWDALERNTLSLAQRGYAFGGDFFYGHRFNWKDWGLNGQNKASDGRDYASIRGYAAAVGGIPFVKSERHRLMGIVHAGVGTNMDRFNQGPLQRPYGGINPVGEEFHSLALPYLPGAAFMEFYPQHYATAYAEYRYAATFFTYLSTYASATVMNPQHLVNNLIERKESILPAIGARVTTGFFGNTRLTLDYTYNWGLVRLNRFGGHSIMMYVAGQFGI